MTLYGSDVYFVNQVEGAKLLLIFGLGEEGTNFFLC